MGNLVSDLPQSWARGWLCAAKHCRNPKSQSSRSKFRFSSRTRWGLFESSLAHFDATIHSPPY